MKSLISLFFAVTLLFLNTEAVFSQTKTKRKKTGAAKTKTTLQKNEKSPAGETNADADVEAQLIEKLNEPEIWKQYVFAEQNYKISLPRTPVKTEEEFYDDALGKVKITVYLSLGDDAAFTAASFSLPYAMTDETLLNEFYNEIAKEFLGDDEWVVKETRDISSVGGNRGLEIDAEGKADQSEKARTRVVLVKNMVFLQMAVSNIAEESGASEIAARNKIERATKMFFDSFADLPKSDTAAAPVPALFKSTFTDGIFRSDYFKFTLKIPEDWQQVSQEDTDGIRKRGREVLEAHTSGDLGKAASERRNLFVFAAKPLGAPKNAMLSGNLIKRPSPAATIKGLSEITEAAIRKVKFYRVVKPTHEIMIGKSKFVGFLLKGSLAEEEFEQGVYFLMRGDYALSFTFTYFDAEQKKMQIDTLASLNFEGK